MATDKTFLEFIKLHGKKEISKDITSIEKQLGDMKDRIFTIIDEDCNKNTEVYEIFGEIELNIRKMKKVLSGYDLFEI